VAARYAAFASRTTKSEVSRTHGSGSALISCTASRSVPLMAPLLALVSDASAPKTAKSLARTPANAFYLSAGPWSTSVMVRPGTDPDDHPIGT